MSDTTDAVVAGHICLDLIPAFPQRQMPISELFVPGRLIQMGDMLMSTGGTVSNTGQALHRLGARVKLMGKLGTDMLASAVVSILESNGADCVMSQVHGEQTSYSVVLAPSGHDRMFLHCPGANDTFTAEDIDYNVVGGARLFHFGYPTLMARMFEREGEELLGVMRLAKETGATTSLDVSLPDARSPAGQAPWERILGRVLPYVDLFMPSVDEAMFMLARQQWGAIQDPASGRKLQASDVELVAGRALAMGAGAAVIKCGTNGVFLASAGADRVGQLGAASPRDKEAWADAVLWHEAISAGAVASALGAGDCAVAGFLAALLRGESPERCLAIACAAGAQNVTMMDALSGITGWEKTSALATGEWEGLPCLADGAQGWCRDAENRVWRKS